MTAVLPPRLAVTCTATHSALRDGCRMQLKVLIVSPNKTQNSHPQNTGLPPPPRWKGAAVNAEVGLSRSVDMARVIDGEVARTPPQRPGRPDPAHYSFPTPTAKAALPPHSSLGVGAHADMPEVGLHPGWAAVTSLDRWSAARHGYSWPPLPLRTRRRRRAWKGDPVLRRRPSCPRLQLLRAPGADAAPWQQNDFN